MDAIFLLVALVVAIAIAYRHIKKDERPNSRSGIGDAARHRTASRPPSFDPVTAKPSPVPKLLTGRAYVVDGDTIVISKTQIRLFGIDAPEIDHPYGQKAKWALVALCKGQVVKAEIGEADHYGRTVASCFLEDGRDLSSEMVRQGLAIDWPKYSGGKYGHLEVPDARKKMWLADARQKGRMHVWDKFVSKGGSTKP